jgi:hypothetical protein
VIYRRIAMLTFILITIFVTLIEAVLVFLFYKTWKSGLMVFTLLGAAVIISAFFIYASPQTFTRADYRIVKESTSESDPVAKRDILNSYYPFAADVFSCEYTIIDLMEDGYHELSIRAILKIDPTETSEWTAGFTVDETLPTVPDWARDMIQQRTYWSHTSTPVRYDAPINETVTDKFYETYLILYPDEGILILSSSTSEF